MSRLYHVSSDPGIRRFEPRRSPSVFEQIRGDVVFAIAERLLHNYLLPRDCPRVGFYAGPQSSQKDIDRFMGPSGASYVLAIEKRWMPKLQGEKIYIYELPPGPFVLLDECAGYYVSYEGVEPLDMRPVSDILGELLARDIELRLLPNLGPLAEAVVTSTMQFSCIRMRNAYF